MRLQDYQDQTKINLVAYKFIAFLFYQDYHDQEPNTVIGRMWPLRSKPVPTAYDMVPEVLSKKVASECLCEATSLLVLQHLRDKFILLLKRGNNILVKIKFSFIRELPIYLYSVSFVFFSQTHNYYYSKSNYLAMECRVTILFLNTIEYGRNYCSCDALVANRTLISYDAEMIKILIIVSKLPSQVFQ